MERRFQYYLPFTNHTQYIPYSGYFSGGGKFSWLWKILRVRGKNFVVSCTRALISVARCIYMVYNCFVGKYFVVYFSTTKTTKILTPEKYPLYCIYMAGAREHNNMMQKLILNYTRLLEHTHLIHVHERYIVV